MSLITTCALSDIVNSPQARVYHPSGKASNVFFNSELPDTINVLLPTEEEMSITLHRYCESKSGWKAVWTTFSTERRTTAYCDCSHQRRD